MKNRSGMKKLLLLGACFLLMQGKAYAEGNAQAASSALTVHSGTARLTDEHVPEAIKSTASAEIEHEEALTSSEADVPKSASPEAMKEQQAPPVGPEAQPGSLPEKSEEEADRATEPGWQSISGVRYYLDALGRKLEGWQKIEGRLRYFDPYDGHLMTGLIDIGDRRYLTDESGCFAYGWQQVGGRLHYFDPGSGAMKRGLFNIGGDTYFTDDAGNFQFGWQRPEGGLRYFDPSTGKMKSGMFNIHGRTYLSGTDGRFKFGWQSVNGALRFFDFGSGAMRTGLFTVGSGTYLADDTGRFEFGFQRVNGKLVYFDPGTGRLRQGLWQLNGATYLTANDGSFRFGWQTVNGQERYFDTATGQMVTSPRRIGGIYYQFKHDGSVDRNLWPVNSHNITSPFGYRIHPIYGYVKFHEGVDIAAPEGAPVYATSSGVVTARSYISGGGNHVTLAHDDGNGSSYLHLSGYNVRLGQHVKKGDVIGYVGSTGASTGSHLHFEFYLKGALVNPLDYVR